MQLGDFSLGRGKQLAADIALSKSADASSHVVGGDDAALGLYAFVAPCDQFTHAFPPFVSCVCRLESNVCLSNGGQT